MMKNVMCVMLVVCVAMAAPALALSTTWVGGVGNWNVGANWFTDNGTGAGVPDGIKTVLGETEFGNPGLEIVTLNTISNDLPVFEVYGGGVLNIEAGGILNVVDSGDAEFKIYTGGNGEGDLGSSINLLGGKIVIQDGVSVQLGDLTDGLFGGNGSNVEGIGWTKVSEGGYTTYTGIGSTFDFDPTPANGATVAAADPLALSWLNLPDPCSVDPVWVDVYWDTDVDGIGGTQELTQAPDALTVDVSADEIGTYYWKIVATDPNTAGVPYVMETAVFSLTTVDGCQAAKDAEPPYTETDARIIGDTNYDCKVNLVDLAALAENWLDNLSL